MIKEKHSWIPAIWGWLPDKTEQTYKVFFLFVQEKLAELNLSFQLKSVISDFELNVMKAIDDILDVDILCCLDLSELNLAGIFCNKMLVYVKKMKDTKTYYV